MTDLELLIFAAKAVNIEWYGYAVDNQCQCRYLDIGEEDVIKWNPLRKDSDAFRLATDLNMSVEISEYEASTYAYAGPLTQPCRVYGYEMWGDDKNAATRRAIVKAAAEIGRNME